MKRALTLPPGGFLAIPAPGIAYPRHGDIVLKQKNLLIGLILLAVALPVAWYFGWRESGAGGAAMVATTAGEDSAETPPQDVVARGRLQPVGGIIDLSGMVGDRVAEIPVHEGQEVKAGTVLATFESFPLRTAELQLAQTELEESKRRLKADLELAKATASEAKIAERQAETIDLEIAAQQNQVKLLESRLRVAKNDAERFKKLDADIVSPQDREHKALLLEQAERELDSSRSLLEKLVKTQELSREAAAAKVRSAEANVLRVEPLARIPALEANVNLAAERARLAQIVAPVDGWVLRISIQAGEMIGQRPIMQFGALEQMEVVAEVYETEVSRVAPGQPVEITTGTKEAHYRNGALPAPLQGKVSRVGSVVAQNEILGIDPAERADARVVSVTILIEKPSDAARRLVNLQVNASIETSKPAAHPPAAATTSAGRAPDA